MQMVRQLQTWFGLNGLHNACLHSNCFNSPTNSGCFSNVKVINGEVPGFYYGNHIIPSGGGSDLLDLKPGPNPTHLFSPEL